MNGKTIAKRIREQKIGEQKNRKVLIVEGNDDEFALIALFKNHHPEYEQNWIIAKAGNKRNVLAVLKEEKNWIGLVDCDEWNQEVIKKEQQKLANLLVLPRFCIENYLINPIEIWQAIPVNQQIKIQNGKKILESIIHSNLLVYIRHCVLWKIITPLWLDLRNLGFKEKLAAEQSVNISQEDEKIQAVLKDWHNLLDPKKIFNKFKQQLEVVENLSVSEQLMSWVHGKIFWKEIVFPQMIRMFGQKSEKEMKKQLFNNLDWPKDLDILLIKMNEKVTL